MLVKNPSLELNWLQKKQKDLLLPNLYFANEIGNAGALYYHIENDMEVLVDGDLVDISKKPLIIIGLRHYGKELDEKSIRSSIAHEWRHHWQQYNTYLLESYHGFDIDWSDLENYKSNIKKFFINIEAELDALLFELINSPDDNTLEWYQWILEEYPEFYNEKIA